MRVPAAAASILPGVDLSDSRLRAEPARFCQYCGGRLAHRAPVTCDGCGAALYANPKPSGSALVTDGDGRCLLVRRARDPYAGAWDIPGGFCDDGESPVETAEREVLEETGLGCRVTHLLGLWVDVYGEQTDRSDRDSTLNIVFAAVRTGTAPATPADPAEVTETAWFGPGELPSPLAFPRQNVPALAAWARLLGGGPQAVRAGGDGLELLDGRLA